MSKSGSVTATTGEAPAIRCINVSKVWGAGTDRAVEALKNFNIEVGQNEFVVLLGPSGCGKSTTGRALLQLQRASSGSVTFQGENLTEMSGERLRSARRHMQMIFQDPFSSLNPRHTVRETLLEPLHIHRIGSAREREARVLELLDLVGLDASHAARYPHEFSGGQRQRVGIARALATSPRLIVADEPISALDVSIQAQLINLLEDLSRT